MLKGTRWEADFCPTGFGHGIGMDLFEAPGGLFAGSKAVLQPGMTHVASVIANGIFERYPSMKFIVIECGVAWLPAILWRLDANWRALRKETPWVKRLPSEYAREHIRLSTQPLERPANKQHLWDVLAAMDGENVLMYASDYPHWDFDAPDQLPRPKEWLTKIMDTNARLVYPKLPPPPVAAAA